MHIDRKRREYTTVRTTYSPRRSFECCSFFVFFLFFDSFNSFSIQSWIFSCSALSASPEKVTNFKAISLCVVRVHRYSFYIQIRYFTFRPPFGVQCVVCTRMHILSIHGQEEEALRSGHSTRMRISSSSFAKSLLLLLIYSCVRILNVNGFFFTFLSYLQMIEPTFDVLRLCVFGQFSSNLF